MSTRSLDHTNLANDPWNHDRDVVLLVNPAARKRVAAWFMLAVVVWLLAYSIFFDETGPYIRWLRQQGRDAEHALIAPTMEKLAADGKRDAIIWLARNGPVDEVAKRVASLADVGDGEALFLMASVAHEADPEEAERLADLSAAAGYPPAIKWQLKVPRRRVTRWE